MDKRCLEEGCVYETKVHHEDPPAPDKEYIGSTSTSFKTRLNNHLSSIRNPDSKQKTTLSSYCVKLDRERKKYHLSHKILARAKPYTVHAGRCNLCNTEKLYIAQAPKWTTLNTRNEIVQKCPHKRQLLLSKRLQEKT